MSRGLWPWGVQFVVFYEVWRLLGAPDSGNLVWRVGPLKEPWCSEVGDPKSLETRSDECLKDCGPRELNLSYSTRSGGSWEVQIPPTCEAGWVRLKNLGLRRSGTRGLRRLEVTNVSRIVALGGSTYRILRRLEAPGRATFRRPSVPGGSA